MRREKMHFYSFFMSSFLQLLINMYAEKQALIPLGYLNFIVPEVKQFFICERGLPVEILYHQHTENSFLKWERGRDRRIAFSNRKITLQTEKHIKKIAFNIVIMVEGASLDACGRWQKQLYLQVHLTQWQRHSLHSFANICCCQPQGMDFQE